MSNSRVPFENSASLRVAIPLFSVMRPAGKPSRRSKPVPLGESHCAADMLISGACAALVVRAMRMSHVIMNVPNAALLRVSGRPRLKAGMALSNAEECIMVETAGFTRKI
jgi:hypothetical protein